MDKVNGLRAKLVIAVFIIIIGGLFVLGFLTPKPAILQSERRAPAKLPRLSAQTVFSGEFMNRLDGYSADNFPFRDRFRTLSSMLVFGVFLQTDKNGLYMDLNGAGEFKRIDPDSVEKIAEKIQTVADALSGVNIFYAFIPDKSIFSEKIFPGFDPVLMEQLLTENPDMDKFTFVSLIDVLDAGCFYRTDLHWNQVKLSGVLDKLGASMGFNIDLSRYSTEYAGEFRGVYSGQIALPIGTDGLDYLSGPYLTATYLNERTAELEPGPVYNEEKLSGLDAYDFFLSGAQPLVILENENSVSDKELYLFRDSFSSSLAPLLASAYSRVILIDLRYIDMRTLTRYVGFKPGSDAIFLYSTLVLSNPDMLLVR